MDHSRHSVVEDFLPGLNRSLDIRLSVVSGPMSVMGTKDLSYEGLGWPDTESSGVATHWTGSNITITLYIPWIESFFMETNFIGNAFWFLNTESHKDCQTYQYFLLQDKVKIGSFHGYLYPHYMITQEKCSFCRKELYITQFHNISTALLV